jgi:predicted restriction endonuclease
VFREALIKYWNGRCPLTAITDIPLLRASHIVPWAECETDFLRLDVHNGLLLSALWDAAFDSGKISFGDDGSILRSPTLTAEANAALRSTPSCLGPMLTGGISLPSKKTWVYCVRQKWQTWKQRKSRRK